MENLMFYDKLRTVPNEAKKPISAGRLKGMTDINPMWRIKRLTEVFGPCGIGWWYEITEKALVPDEETKQVAAFLDINLFYKDPESGETSKPIPGTGGASFVAQERNGPYCSDECFKMALTDAISVAAKSIGVAADVYFEKDRDKYTANDTAEEKPAPAAKKAPVAPPPGSPAYEAKQPERFVCADCGEVIKPWVMSGETKMSVREIAQNTESEFGRRLCLNCIKKEKAKANDENAG